MEQVKKTVPTGTVLMRVRKFWALGGLEFKQAGRSKAARAEYGTWRTVDKKGRVDHSAAADGDPAETLRALARRLRLLEPWEQ